jgi:glycosyltransferase involved in cell wall biosynthesis
MVGLKTWLREHRLGLVVEAYPNKVAEGVFNLLSNPDRMKEIVNKGNQYINRNFTHEIYAARILKLFNKIL